MTEMASQAHVDRLREAGRAMVETFRTIVATSYGADYDEQSLDVALGRELGMALFLAGVGDKLFSRFLFVHGLGLALGECAAQQGSASAAQALVDTMQDGVRAGADFVNQGFARAGRA
jgi:hypothetical protein